MEWIELLLVVSFMAVLISAITSRAYHYYRRLYYTLPVWDAKKGHHWNHFEECQYPGAVYCNVCGTGITTDGLECDFCGIVADDECIAQANANLICKHLSSEGPLRHQWMSGNLPEGPESPSCIVCEEICGGGPGLRDCRCIWCQITVHSGCKPYYTDRCDLGKFKRMIIPPNVVKLKLVGIKGHRHLTVSECTEPSISNWRPLIVISNKLSGNGEGDLVLRAFRRILNPIQVVDLSQVPPEFCLEWCRLVKQCTVLIAGGDGTVSWVLDTAEKLKLSHLPEFGVLPLGTGNDLSRVLGWGPGHTGPIDPFTILGQLTTAQPTHLDRWGVQISPRRSKLFRPLRPLSAMMRRPRSLKMTNYLSVGVDALVTLNFHNRRSRMPRVLSGRLMNKFLFFSYGTKDVLERACQHLGRHVSLYLDGKLIDLPDDIEGIVCLNIPSWGAGVTPWTLGSGCNLGTRPLSRASSCSLAQQRPSPTNRPPATGSNECSATSSPRRKPPSTNEWGATRDSPLRECTSYPLGTSSTDRTISPFSTPRYEPCEPEPSCSRDSCRITPESGDTANDIATNLAPNRDDPQNYGSYTDTASTSFSPDSDRCCPAATISCSPLRTAKPRAESSTSSIYRSQAIDDGLLEVFAVYSSFHIAQMQVGLSEPLRLGQASHIRLVVGSASSSSPPLPMQVDGEPWLQGPAVIVITPTGVVTMLAAPPPVVSPCGSDNSGGFFFI